MGGEHESFLFNVLSSSSSSCVSVCGMGRDQTGSLFGGGFFGGEGGVALLVCVRLRFLLFYGTIGTRHRDRD